MRPGLFAFAVASGFLGAALYITVVEQPARLVLDTRAMIREWHNSNRRSNLNAIPPGSLKRPAVRTLMRDWALLEWGKTAIALAACCCFAWALVLPS